jgi:hypothetical protein
MDNLIIALFETSAALVFFYIVYAIWLQNETFFAQNRLYLLLSSLLSVILPWINFSIPRSSGETIYIYNLLDAVTVTATGYENIIVQKISTLQWLAIIYFLGVIFMLVLFLINLYKITRINKISYKKIGDNLQYNVRFVKADTVPFSFLHKIYINPDKYTNEQLTKIISHESVHIAQYHTYDCLFYELLIVFFWFNPIVYKYRKAAKEIHEFLADKGAVNSGISKADYQHLLFQQATGLNNLALPNSFNYSLIKRRLIMLTKIKTSKAAKFKLLFALPVAATLLLIFSCNKDTEKNIEEIKNQNTEIKNQESEIIDNTQDEPAFFIVDQMPEFQGGESALRMYIAENVKYPEKAVESKTEAIVYVQFVVDKNGNVVNVKNIQTRVPVYNKAGDIKEYTQVFNRENKDYNLLEAEAVRVVKSQPKWTPGMQKGEYVNVSFTIPIVFSISGKEYKKQ